MEHKEYNGWTNYETWNWNLWYSNSFTAEDFDGLNGDIHKIAGFLEDWTGEMADEIGILNGQAFFSDVIRASMNEVNFEEIAEHFVDDYELASTEEAS